MWAQAIATALGLWLMAAPAVLGYVDDPMEASDRITGPIVITFAFLGMFAITQGVRWINLGAGLWLLVGPWFLYQSTAALVNSLVVGVLLLVLTPIGDPQPEQYGGGWPTLTGRRATPR